MAYSSFTLNTVKSTFGVVTNEQEDLFAEAAPVLSSNLLQLILKDQVPLAGVINTEKARSELIIMPVLMEVRRQLQNRISIFSGSNFEVDPAQGLEGCCDFILSGSSEQYYIAHPVLAIAEAKNESIPSGLGQCAATMIAAQLFNQRQDQSDCTHPIYGVVTTGTIWKFLKLAGQVLFIDVEDYYIKEVDKLLGILISICQIFEA
ncbi:MAG: hypothetical protein VKJ64_04785 [Leptolyngbyaceae bacterium]|nr:hypothetical protein [Leptolyngbyaceae bacterium]